MKLLVLIAVLVLVFGLWQDFSGFDNSQAPPGVFVVELPTQVADAAAIGTAYAVTYVENAETMLSETFGGDIAQSGLSIALSLLVLIATVHLIGYTLTQISKRRQTKSVPSFNPHSTEISLT